MNCKYHPEVEMIPLRLEDLKWLTAERIKEKNPDKWRVCPKCNTMSLVNK